VAQRPEPEPLIESALQAIADGTPLPWSELDRATSDPARLDVLRTLDAIASAYRARTPASAPERRLLFRWGPLDVEELIGKGSFGEVYRAFDPWLGRAVALKLFRDFDNAPGLDEARRLARVRDRNVLSVYGCGVHDGRAGLWSELIVGRTLAEAVAADGALSEPEALRVGCDLARALAVVHAAGLIHGDVKAENVMRESGGRVVLMDFGAGGDARLLASARLICGTPRYLPPEVLDGAALTASSDVYALGVLMFLLLGGRYPYDAADAPALREAQRRGDRPSLRALRPQLGQALSALVESCIATDATQRPADAQTLRDAFGRLMQVPAEPRRRSSVAALAAALVAVLIAGMALWSRPELPPWDCSAQFRRVEPSGEADLSPDATLRVGDRLRLSLRSSRDTYVYVLSEDAAGNATVLYPLSSGPQKPQAAGTTLTLPGVVDPALAWVVTADSAREEFVVISALAPRAEIEAELAGWKRARPAEERAVGAVARIEAPQVQGARLQRILQVLQQDAAHVRVWQYSFAHHG
jgi:hypothetical protein